MLSSIRADSATRHRRDVVVLTGFDVLGIRSKMDRVAG
jgi:hypothetical protein